MLHLFVQADTSNKHVAAGAFGYNPAVHGGLIVGRTWTLDLTKSF